MLKKLIILYLITISFNAFSQRKKNDKIPYYKERIIFFNDQKKIILSLNDIKVGKLKSNLDYYYENLNFEKTEDNDFIKQEKQRLENKLYFYKLRKDNHLSDIENLEKKNSTLDSINNKKESLKLRGKIEYVRNLSKEIDSIDTLISKQKIKLDSIYKFSKKHFEIEISETKKIIQEAYFDTNKKVKAMNSNIEIYKDSIAYAVKNRKKKRF